MSRGTRSTTPSRFGAPSRRAVLGSLAVGVPGAAVLTAPGAEAVGSRSLSVVTVPSTAGPGDLIAPWSVLLRDGAGARVAGSLLSFRVVRGPHAEAGASATALTGPDGIALAPAFRAARVPGEMVVQVTSDRSAAVEVGIEVGVTPGDVLAWGLTVGPHLTTVTNAGRWSSLTSGPGVAAVVCADGSVRRWQTDEAPVDGGTAPPVPDLAVEWADVVALSFSQEVTAALHRDGSISVAAGTDPPSKIPPVVGATSVSASARGLHVLDADGTVWAWGAPAGHSGLPIRAPRPVPGLHGVVAVTAGGGTVFAVEADGEVWGWGEDAQGQLGGHGGSSAPRRIRLDDDVVAVAAGRASGCAATRDGRVWAWGDGRGGQLGRGDRRSSPVPRLVEGLPAIRSIAAGGATVCSTDVDGAVWSWGCNDDGQLGDGSTTTRTRPVRVPGLTGIQQVVTDGRTSHALG